MYCMYVYVLVCMGMYMLVSVCMSSSPSRYMYASADAATTGPKHPLLGGNQRAPLSTTMSSSPATLYSDQGPIPRPVLEHLCVRA